MARAPRVQAVEGAPAEPDLLDNAPPPREATALFGHGDASRALAARFANRSPQGIILSGPRGIGKATLAFRLTKSLLSGTLDERLWSDEEGRDARQVSAGTHPAMLHLTRPFDDKARPPKFKAELSVDTVRRIIPFLGATAAGEGRRIIIVDALDDMSPSAANALLKSLEEPPRGAVFLLIAHIAGRILPTIRSRCEVVRLAPLAEPEVAAALSHLGADPRLAAGGNGSVRDALVLAAAGSDAVHRAQSILSGSLIDSRARFALADLGSAKRGEHFAAVADLVFQAFAARVHGAAARAPLAALDAAARAYLDALAERRKVEIFNLDKKAFLLSLGEQLGAVDHALGTPTRR